MEKNNSAHPDGGISDFIVKNLHQIGVFPGWLVSHRGENFPIGENGCEARVEPVAEPMLLARNWWNDALDERIECA